MRDAEQITNGSWGAVQWELYRSQTMPAAELCTAAGCVAIRDIAAQEVVLTYTPARYTGDGKSPGRWEILGGHVDLVNPQDPKSSKERPEQTVRREALEEGGFYAGRMEPFAYRKIINPTQGGECRYPSVGYYPFYWAISGEQLTQPTDPEQPASGTFTMDQVNSLVRHNLMDPVERDIVQLGLTAAAEALR